MLRSHTCGDLRKKDVTKKVTLAGWVHSRRDHGGVIFIDLRDRYGLTQIVFDSSHKKNILKSADSLRREFVIQVSGVVKRRKQGMINKKIDSGEIEVFADELEIFNKSLTPPIEISERADSGEDVRLKYRYVDIRREELKNNFILRHNVIKDIRDFFDSQGFLEIETPILGKSTPEGARDFIVPSRIKKGEFYALPQSPQIFKQLLMLSGFDKYVQIVKCFRDEDLRADRQPEFTQVDVEMSFVEEKDIINIMEQLMKYVLKKQNIKVKTPFKRLTHKEAMEKYGSDKPDLRFGMELMDVSNIVKKSKFTVFKSVLDKGGRVKCIKANNDFSRKNIDKLIEFVKIYDAKGLAWMKYDGKLESSIVKFFPEKVLKEIAKRTRVKKGDYLFFVADRKHHIVDVALGQLRLKLAKELKLIKKEWNFLWVVDFPLVEYDELEKRHISIHHPFTKPKEKHIKFLDKDPGKVLSDAYDLVLNGVELGGGSIRIHKSELQSKIFKTLGISKKEADSKFGFLLEAFKYGTPPHGGIALGLDRFIMLLSESSSLRDVIAFPKTKSGDDLMMNSPSEVSQEQLKDVGINVKKK